ncbi:LAGLIDADG family homing endonuclease [Neobacillus sp. PS3-40]|uniref:LAGLIDADG family homing endonuclease n=1 Tax=Neobacillus sp. PS3-40 TaxID=3070679 RepID=UPI0027DF5D5F|nr:LAGLIDADG family homing endonuclease [Neobacillus sp. PS3-40]WML45408.1 LAGLIDADG family homing endonuclease [Neobacillus sp. PS3-40]
MDLFEAGIITGFTMGEGCFCIKITKSKTHRTGYQIVQSFKISLKREDKKILQFIKKRLRCGKVRIYKNCSVFEVVKMQDILEIIIPFFNQFPLKNVKHKDFLYFKIICYKLIMGEGREIEGINRIISIRNKMNKSGEKNRRYKNIIKHDF